MKINWKVRLKNKLWLSAMAALILSFVYGLLDLLGIIPEIPQEKAMTIVQSVLTFLGLIGVIADPTTQGMGDSERALSYTEPWKDTPEEPEGYDTEVEKLTN